MPQQELEVKVLTKNSYRWWKLGHDLIFFGVPIIYLIIFYELFNKKSNVPFETKITVVGWIVIIIALALFKTLIFNLLDDIRKNFSIISQRIMKAMILGIISVAILFSSLWVKHLVLLLLVFCISMVLSIYPLYKYTKNKEYYDFVKDIQKGEEVKSQVNSGKLKVK